MIFEGLFSRDRTTRKEHVLDGDDPTSWPTLEPEQVATWQPDEPVPDGVIAGWISEE